MSLPIPPEAIVCDVCGEAACLEARFYWEKHYRIAGFITRREWEERHAGPKISARPTKTQTELAEALRRIQADMYERGGEE